MDKAGAPDERASAQPAGPDEGRRACDQCRMRKIRCDKEFPTCSNCRTARRSCTSTGAGQRFKEARARVLISSQYEKKIDRIDARLSSIESILKSLSTSNLSSTATTTPSNPAPSTSSQPSSTPQTLPFTNPASTSTTAVEYDSSDDESVYGGDNGLTTHTQFASDFVESAIRRTTLKESNPAVDAALAKLSQLVDMQKRRSISHGPKFPLQLPVPPGGVCKLPLPPLETVVALLKQNKGAPPTLFSTMTALVGIRDFASLCRLVYFAADDFSEATFSIVNSGLYNLFLEEHATTADPVLRAQYEAWMKMCGANLETCLANLPLFLSPRTENVQALLLGANYAVDVSRPSVAWHLISSAAQLCQTGGYHRVECLRNDPPAVVQTKNILFWNVYSLDKGLGLRLGRSSVIHDCDISIERTFNYTGVDLLQESALPNLWLRISYLQSQIYEQLYSPAALNSSQAELIRKAQSLAVECRNLEKILMETRSHELEELRAIQSSKFIEIFLMGDEVQFYVTTCLVYRILPANKGSVSRFCDECLESARAAMSSHHKSVLLLNTSDYLQATFFHWNIMLTPFAPFFVLFCYVIETSSPLDIKILQDFVSSLDLVRSASVTVDKLFRLCSLMTEVAMLYVDAKSQQQRNENMAPIGDEFEMYLSQLGFMPGEDQAMMNAGDTGGVLPAEGQGEVAQISNWFSGSRNMFGLLEEDWSQIDPSFAQGGGAFDTGQAGRWPQ